MDPHGLLARTRSSASLLIATDLDGTIADIVVDPSRAHLRDDARVALAALASLPGVHIAVVSGRTMESLRALTCSLDPLIRVAEHGASFEFRGDPVLVVPSSVPAEVVDAIARAAVATAMGLPGLRVERKTSGVAMHVRAVPPARRTEALAALSAFRTRALASGLSLIEGREVVEARATDASKADALAAVIERLPRGTFVVYAGDDTTDEAAISFASRVGVEGAGIYVASEERPRPMVRVDLVVEGPAAWAALLAEIAATRRALLSCR